MIICRWRKLPKYSMPKIAAHDYAAAAGDLGLELNAESDPDCFRIPRGVEVYAVSVNLRQH